MLRNRECLVCGDYAGAVHFGALSCRACAAFFRRKVAARKILVSRCNNQCEIKPALRKICPHCRFSKCLKVGMKESTVLSRISVQYSENNPTSYAVNQFNQESIVGQISDAYNRLEYNRRRTFGEGNKYPKLANYKMLNDTMYTDIKLIMENFITVFQSVSPIKKDQMDLLINRFILSFIMWDYSYKSTGTNLFLLPTGDYIDYSNVELFYQDHNEKNEQINKRAYEIFKPYWSLYHKSMKMDIDEIQLDRTELIVLLALIFWDFGLTSQTEECMQVCLRIREKVVREFEEYERNKSNDHFFRIAQILMLLQTNQKMMNMTDETFEISRIYNILEHHEAVNNIISNKIHY